jgi:hypothetical protein
VGAPYGSAGFLAEASVVIADGGSPEDTWSPSELVATAPADAVEARVVVLFRQPASNPGGAVFVDSVTLEVACPCEIDGNGAVVDGFDLLAYLFRLDGPGDSGEFDGEPGVNFFDLLAFLECWEPAMDGACPGVPSE